MARQKSPPRLVLSFKHKSNGSSMTLEYPEKSVLESFMDPEIRQTVENIGVLGYILSSVVPKGGEEE